MASYPTSANAFGTIAASGAARSSMYSERTAVATLISELSAVVTDLVAARGASASIALRLTAIDTAVTSAIATASADATTKANNALAAAIIYRSGRNVVPNGNNVIRQRGNGPFTANGYSVDGMYLNRTGSTVSHTLELHAPGAIPGIKESGYHNKTVVTSVANAANLAN